MYSIRIKIICTYVVDIKSIIVYVYKTIENKYFYSGNHVHNYVVDEKYSKREQVQKGIECIMKKVRNKINITEEANDLYDSIVNPHISFESCRQFIFNQLFEQKEKVLEEVRDEGLDYKILEEKDMVIYGDQQNISKFKLSQIIFADGTFKVCPQDWYQLYILNGIVDNKRMTFFYCLLKNKTKALYKRMFDAIDKLTDGGIYKRNYTLMGDFEIINFDFLGKNVRKKCCNFHFCQCIERNYNEKRNRTDEDLKKRYKLKKTIDGIVHMPTRESEEFIRIH